MDNSPSSTPKNKPFTDPTSLPEKWSFLPQITKSGFFTNFNQTKAYFYGGSILHPRFKFPVVSSNILVHTLNGPITHPKGQIETIPLPKIFQDGFLSPGITRNGPDVYIYGGHSKNVLHPDKSFRPKIFTVLYKFDSKKPLDESNPKLLQSVGQGPQFLNPKIQYTSKGIFVYDGLIYDKYVPNRMNSIHFYDFKTCTWACVVDSIPRPTTPNDAMSSLRFIVETSENVVFYSFSDFKSIIKFELPTKSGKNVVCKTIHLEPVKGTTLTLPKMVQSLILRENIYLFGGLDKKYQCVKESCVFDTLKNCWRKHSASIPCFQSQLDSHSGKVFLFGGSWGTNSQIDNRILEYNLEEEDQEQGQKF